MPSVVTSHGTVNAGETIRVTAKTIAANGREPTFRKRSGMVFNDRQLQAVKVLDETDAQIAARSLSGQYAVNLAGVTAIDGDTALVWFTAAEHTARAAVALPAGYPTLNAEHLERDRVLFGI